MTLKVHPKVLRGMDNLVIDSTSVSWIDGKNNKLYYRGIEVSELATNSTFEETAYLLMCGHLPTINQLQSFTWKMRQMMHTQEKVMRIIQELPQSTQPLFALQTALSSLASIDSSHGDNETDGFETSMRIVAQTPVIVAAAYRHFQNIPFISPREDLNHAENFLYMLTGKIPNKNIARSMEISLILQMDNGFTPSTFAARLVASTLTNFYSAACAAAAALSGPLVGGSCLQVYELLREAREQSNIESFIINKLNRGEKIPGLGHRVYETSDPRANILEKLIFSIETRDKQINKDFNILQQILNVAKDWYSGQNLSVFPNIDFWSSLFFQKLTLQPILFPALTAASRVAGWTAHMMELRSDNCLYRPRSLYTGPIGVSYSPIEKRK